MRRSNWTLVVLGFGRAIGDGLSWGGDGGWSVGIVNWGEGTGLDLLSLNQLVNDPLKALVGVVHLNDQVSLKESMVIRNI